MPPAFFAALFLAVALGIITTATLGYLFSGRSREARFALVVSLLLIAALFAFSPLLFIAGDPQARAAFEKKAHAYAQEQEKGAIKQKEEKFHSEGADFPERLR